jgi:hypothetical protein
MDPAQPRPAESRYDSRPDNREGEFAASSANRLRERIGPAKNAWAIMGAFPLVRFRTGPRNSCCGTTRFR